ncbi:hypothetical protein GGR54DRAFT_450075 [Hypoxylon sp. NC1633]|nr:hypothetical protein GGR54DRAFT_450075 [Hypoxylon sp. NC1633]
MDQHEAEGSDQHLYYLCHNTDFQDLRLRARSLKKDNYISPGNKILHEIRCAREKHHRASQYARSAHVPMTLPFPVGQPGGRDQPLWHILDCFNKSTALYIFDSRQLFPYIGAMGIDVWLYRQWFRPFRSNIELGRYIAKVFAVEYDPRSVNPGSDLDKLIALHCNVCEQSKRIADTTAQHDPFTQAPVDSVQGPLRAESWKPQCFNFKDRELMQKDWRETHILQPLFRALFMVLVVPEDGDWKPWLVDGVMDVANLKVRLVKSGSTNGLSAPISFSPLAGVALDDSYRYDSPTITTTLAEATRFIMDLETREMMTFGMLPDITSISTSTIDYWMPKEGRLTYALELGWDRRRDGSLFHVPKMSSQWVSQRVFGQVRPWMGEGAHLNLVLAQKMVQRMLVYEQYPYIRPEEFAPGKDGVPEWPRPDDPSTWCYHE